MPEVLNRIKIGKSFGSASESYDVSSRLQRYTGKQLLPWLPNRSDLDALDLGSGTGFFTDLLAGRYQQVFGLDISSKMLTFAKAQRDENICWVQGDAFHLPFQNDSLDFIYSNLVIQWCDPLDAVIDEILRVLKPGGLFVFTTLIDGTLHELKSSWAQVDNDKHVIDFKIEAEVIENFTRPNCRLLEHNTKNIALEYENVLHLAHELKGLGANHVPKKSNKGLAGKDKWQKMTNAYQDFQEPNGVYPASYNVFSGLLVKLN
jgi:malonyl-CoA O-methyltransferase